MDFIEVNNNKFLLSVRSTNKPRVSSSIKKGKITITIPNFLNREEKFKEILKMKSWAINEIQNDPTRFIEKQKEYKSEDKIKIGEKEYTLSINFENNKGSSAKIKNNFINLLISKNLSNEEKNNSISTLLSRCIAKDNIKKVKDRIHELNQVYFNKKVNNVFLKHNKSNWGSCSTNNNINISTRSLLAPNDVLDYIYIHELAHLIERNHSENFWNLIERSMPNYKEKIKWIKQNKENLKF